MMPLNLKARWLFCLLFCLQPVPGRSQVTSANSHLPAESLLLSAGDLVAVSVFDVPEFEKHVRVTDQGSVRLPLVGALFVAGLTPGEAEQTVSAALAAGGFMQNAQVSVEVDQYASAEISVSGQVQHPGSYPVTTPRDLMDVVSQAGGLTPAADTLVTIRRRGAQGTTLQASLVNDPRVAMRNSILVYPGDLVIVPKAGIVYVLGDVARPGGYAMVNDAQLSLMEAVALAAGTNKTASETHVRLIRKTADGPIDIPVSLKAMEQGTTPDMQLRPEDVIYIPYSTTKNIMLGASAILSSTSGAAIYAAH